MKGRFNAVLARYGQTVTVTNRSTGETTGARAFVQPVLRRQKNAPLTATPLGAVCEERWLYLGCADTPLRPGDRVEHGNAHFTVQEARRVYWRDEIAYWWAMLRAEKEAAL